MLKHFLKTLAVFIVMIILGLLGVFLINEYNDEIEASNPLGSQAQVAK